MQRTLTHSPGHSPTAARRGSVFATALWIIIALTAVVLVTGREMTVEAMAAKQHLSQAQVDAAEQGAEQFALSVVAQELQTPGYMSQLNFEARPLGNCYIWFIRQNMDDETQLDYGMQDEAAKIDINTATETMLEYLPNMDVNVAASIVDWRDADDNVTQAASGAIGAESSDYSTMTTPYSAKNAPFETVEELMLVEGMTSDLAWGADRNHNNAVEANESANINAGANFDSNTMLGIFSYVTVYGVRATNASQSATTNTASSGTVITGLGNDDTTDQSTLADVNNTQQMQTMLQNYLPAKASQLSAATGGGGGGGGGGRGGAGGGAGGGTTTQTYTSVWDWVMQKYNAGQLTSEDLQQIYPYLTYNPPANQTTTTQDAQGDAISVPILPYAKLNINTASEAALMCLPGWTQADADAVIQYRENNANTDPTQINNISWLLDVLSSDASDVVQYVKTGPNTSGTTTTGTTGGTTGGTGTGGTTTNNNPNDPNANPGWGVMITGSSTVYSADIVTVSQDGRAFKRVKVVVDASSGTPQIVYRRDLSDAGWPLDPSVLESLRSGQGPVNALERQKSSSPLSIGVR